MHYTAVAPYMYPHDILITRLSELNQGFARQAVKAEIVLPLFPDDNYLCEIFWIISCMILIIILMHVK